MNKRHIWIESDIFGSKHVMVQDDDLEPFTYCTFYYDYRYTYNSNIRRMAEAIAFSIGAEHPIEYRNREFKME
jgi:hypothetical protein